MFKGFLSNTHLVLIKYGCGRIQKHPASTRVLQLRRPFSSSIRQQTDGVFRALTASRTPIPWIEALKKQQQKEQSNGDESKADEPVKRSLAPKRMSDSYHSVILPLAQDKWLSDTYLNVTGHLRLGTILMDLDALSGVICYKHTGEGVTSVTAALDRITIENPLTELCDLEYSGHVTYATGRSSMEISCRVSRARKEHEEKKPEDILLTCSFTMVSLDPITKKPTNIPALIIETPEERAIYDAGAARSAAKKAMHAHSLLAQEPNDDESALIHSMWLHEVAWHDPNKADRAPKHLQKMSATKLQTAAIMQPQYRNRHNYMIFGGYLLKASFELSFCAVSSFAHSRPKFISADPCTFLNPVPVGSVLYLTATVAYCDPPLIDTDIATYSDNSKSWSKPKQTRVQVRVDSKVRNVEHGTVKPTGQFHYTFLVDGEVGVIPQTYTEFMVYIDARRRVKKVFEDPNIHQHAREVNEIQAQQVMG